MTTREFNLHTVHMYNLSNNHIKVYSNVHVNYKDQITMILPA